MQKAIKCAGYALMGSAMALGAAAAFVGIMVLSFYSAELVGNWFALSRDYKNAIALAFVLAAIGALFGAIHCHERNRLGSAE
jgi:hypothetical protein